MVNLIDECKILLGVHNYFPQQYFKGFVFVKKKTPI